MKFTKKRVALIGVVLVLAISVGWMIYEFLKPPVPVRLTIDPAWDVMPQFSPDGKDIVFDSDRTDNFDIWIMSQDGTNQRQLTFNESHDETPSFSPCGKKIVFASNRAVNSDIWIMNYDGTGQRRLTFDYSK